MNKKVFTLLFLSLIVVLYVVTYFITTSVFEGSFETDEIDLRLFSSNIHYKFFKPMILVETSLRSIGKEDREFYGHIMNGASLPPSRL